MVDRSIIQCDVCKSTILVRTQVGYLPYHPIRIYCANCGILISGQFKQPKDEMEFSITYDNAKKISNIEIGIDYCIEVSGELTTQKIHPYNEEKDKYQFSPYLKMARALGDDFEKFKSGFLRFLNFIDNNWPYVRRITDLWIEKRFNYIRDQLKNILASTQFPCTNELELLRGIHMLWLRGFSSLLPEDFYSGTTEKIFLEISTILNSNSNGYYNLCDYFYTNRLLDNYEKTIHKICNSFVEKYPFLIVASGLDYYLEKPDLNTLGTVSASFDDIKHFYQDCFECIGEVISLVVALNNLRYRMDFNSMPSVANVKASDIASLNKQTKGNKLKFCADNEIFSQIIKLQVSAEQRNMIGHLECYEYNGVSQTISYYPSCTFGKGEKKDVFLLDFIHSSWKQFQTIIVLNELVYQTRKNYYAFKGLFILTPNKKHCFLKEKQIE